MHELNATMVKFGAPDSCIRNYDHWTVLLRPAQATLGALVLAAYEPVTSFANLSRESFTELHKVTGEMEQALSRAFNYEKLNYLMLMMVDPDVHFHVLPRYPDKKEYGNSIFTDPGWPGPPDLKYVNETDVDLNSRIRDEIKSCWIQ